MGFREFLNKNKPAAVAVALGLAGVGVAAGYVLQRPSGEVASGVSHSYYTVDDGATYFAEAAGRICPFDHEGKPAYAVRVFKCSDKDKPFVGYLERVEEKTLADAKAAEMAKKPREEIESITRNHLEVKKPGEEEWVKSESPEGGAITTIQCPTAIIVLP